jgi:hypothetical protein
VGLAASKTGSTPSARACAPRVKQPEPTDSAGTSR